MIIPCQSQGRGRTKSYFGIKGTNQPYSNHSVLFRTPIPNQFFIKLLTLCPNISKIIPFPKCTMPILLLMGPRNMGMRKLRLRLSTNLSQPTRI